MRATSYFNDAIIDKTIFNQLYVMIPYVDIIGLCHSIAILWEIYDATYMSCEVTSVPFQAQVNYGTWLIDFDHISILLFRNSEINVIIFNLISYNDDKILKTLSYLNAIMKLFLSLKARIHNSMSTRTKTSIDTQ